jgi:hypothetical protein
MKKGHLSLQAMHVNVKLDLFVNDLIFHDPQTDGATRALCLSKKREYAFELAQIEHLMAKSDQQIAA